MSRYFSDEETACHCGCGFNTVNPILMDKLDQMREAVGGPIILNDVCRCQEHNDSIPGSVHNSQHVLGNAADVHVPEGYDVDSFAELAISIGFDGIGRYYDSDFVHCDVRDNGESPNGYTWTDQD